MGQELSASDREKLTRAERTADEFVARFRKTLNFGLVWKEFRSREYSCQLVKSDIVTNVSDEEKARIGTALLEKAYIALMNYYYLKTAHDLSIDLISSPKTEEQITPKQILRMESSNVYVKTNGKSPTNVREIEEYITELDRLVKLYRRHLPRNVMNSAAWHANMKYLMGRGGVTHLGIGTGDPDFCIAQDAKYFIVDRGMFYFYIVEELGQMKVIELAVGD